MSVLAFKNGDIVLDDQGIGVMLDGVDEVIQLISAELQIEFGEWFLAPEDGAHLIANLQHKGNARAVEEEIRRIILKHVDRIESITVSGLGANRKLAVDFVAFVGNQRITGNEVIA